MRKYAAILCALLLAGSLCACKEADKAADSKPTHSKAPTIPTPTTTVAVPDMAPGKEPLNLTAATAFSDGVAFVTYVDDREVAHKAAINLEGEILFSLPDEPSFEGAQYQNGICVVGNVIYDKTGTVIASPELSGYDTLVTGNCGGYVLAEKVAPVSQPALAPDKNVPAGDVTTNVPVTSSVQLSMGVLNSEGQWEHPLSEEHPIARAITASAMPAETYAYDSTAGVLKVQVDSASVPQYYHFEDNVLTASYTHYSSLNYQEGDSGIYKFDNDGEAKLVLEGIVGDYFFKDAFIGRETEEDELGEIKTVTRLYDYSGDVKMELTAYVLPPSDIYYVSGHLVFCDTSTGSRRLTVLGDKGAVVLDLPLEMRDKVFAPDKDGFVVESHTAEGVASYSHYGFDGTVTEYPHVATFGGFCEGLAVATLTDGTLCYINSKAEIVIR